MLLIGFGYRARQGKNTAAMAMLESCPLDTDVRLYAFADALRQEVRVACARMGGQYALIEGFKESGLMPDWVHFEEPKPRSLLQWWGTEYRRAKHPDYWVSRLRKALDAHQPQVALITDVRFPNEVEAIKSWGGYVVNVTRTTAPDVEVHEHASEAALDGFDGWDFHLEAETKQELTTKAVALFKELNVSLPRSGNVLRPGH